MSSDQVTSPKFSALVQDSTRPLRLGLLGGTFDPVHLGHLLLAEQAYCQFDLDGVILIPTGQPVRKLYTVSSTAEDRYAMLMLAIGSNPHFDVSRLELDRPGVTYTIDTIRIIRDEFGDKAELFFIAGIDATYDLGTWKDAEELARQVTILSANRGGIDDKSLSNTHLEVDFRVLEFKIPDLEISSQQIREYLQSGRSVRYLVPDTVIDYIETGGLYQAGNELFEADGGD